MVDIFGGLKNKNFFWLTGNLHYFFGLLRQNYFLEIDFHLLFRLFFETKLIKFILKRHYSSKLKH